MDDVNAALNDFVRSGRDRDPAAPADATRSCRDGAAVRAYGARARGLMCSAPAALAHRETMCGGGQARYSSAAVAPPRIGGETLSPGYVSLRHGPGANPADYLFARHPSGYRIAVHKSAFAGGGADELLQRIAAYGPQRAGYALEGDTLVPGGLSPGDRRALATARAL